MVGYKVQILGARAAASKVGSRTNRTQNPHIFVMRVCVSGYMLKGNKKETHQSRAILPLFGERPLIPTNPQILPSLGAQDPDS